MRVALLTNIVPPYRVPVFRALAATPGWELRVFTSAEREFDRDWDAPDLSGLDVEVAGGASRVRGDRTLHLPWRLLPALQRFRPDVVVSGELGARTALASAHCRRHGVPLVVWSYSTRARLALDGALRRQLGNLLLAGASAVVGMGSEARRTLRQRGVADDRIFDAPNAHDVETFRKAEAAVDREAAHRDLRVGLDTRARIALVAGRLFEIKGVAPLLDAWDRVPSGLRRDWTLLFVGNGPEAARLARASETHRPGEIVRVPAVQPRELAAFHAAADFLAFPSLGDVWGLAVNEAMASGLPVLCSSRAGCAPDLVRPGETGWLADPLDTDAFAAALGDALSCGQRQRLGEQAREAVAGFTPEAMAEGFRQAAHAALQLDRKPEGRAARRSCPRP